MVEKINDLIKSNIYDKIIFTLFRNKKNSLFERKLNWTRLQSEDEQQIVVDIPNNSIIFEKFGYGIGDKDLHLLKDNNIKTIDICGVQTDACVYAIALQLFDVGIYPNVLINYTQTVDDKRQQNAKEFLIHQFGAVDEKKQKIFLNFALNY